MVNVQMVMRVALLVGGIGSLVSAASPSAADEKEEAAITTERLTKLYATDPEQFDKKYKGKVVAIEGVVELGNFKDSLTEDRWLMVKGYHKPKEPVSHSIRCQSGPEFESLRMGHKIRIQGTCQGHSKTSRAAELRDCKLLKVLSDDYPPSKAAQEAATKLRGQWKVTSGEADGKQLTPKEVDFDEVVIEGYEIQLHFGDRVQIWGLGLDPTKTPKAMDLVNPDEHRLPLIYAQEGDKLRLGFPAPAKELKDTKRPESFDTTKSRRLMLVAERQK